MKKSIFFTFAVFAITLFCSQIASGQWVVCNNNSGRGKAIYVSAPHFSTDLIAETYAINSEAAAEVYWNKPQGGYIMSFSYCDYPDCYDSRNIGTQNGGGLYIHIHCHVDGKGYAKAELWSW